MQLDYCMPTADLTSALSIIGHVRGTGAATSDTVPALLPNLHIRLRGQSRYAFARGGWRTVPPVALVGTTTAAFRMDVSGDFDMVCVGFMPTGWGRFLGLPAGDLTDTMVDAASVWPASAIERLRQAVASAASLPLRRTVVELFLRAHERNGRGIDWRRVCGVEHWLEQPGTLTLDALATALELSPRQIARITLRTFGTSPKTLAMKYRALRMASALTIDGRAAVMDAPDDFADQSHLIRDFHRFVGWTPGAFLSHRQPLAHATMLSRWQAGARSRLALCS